MYKAELAIKQVLSGTIAEEAELGWLDEFIVIGKILFH